MDLPHHSVSPKPGDVIQAVGVRGPGTAYVIRRSRAVVARRPRAVQRYAMQVSVIGRGIDALVSVDRLQSRVFTLKWYPRKRST